MSITYADHQTAVVCPVCSSIPCGCSRLTLALEWAARQLRHWVASRQDTRQRYLQRAAK